MLIETGLIAAGRVSSDRPISAGIGGEHFVNQHQFGGWFVVCIKRKPKLKLRVRQDQSTRACSRGGRGVNVERHRSQALGKLATNGVAHGGEGDIFVVTFRRLGSGRKDRLGELLALAKPGWQWDATRRSIRLVLLPTAARQVTARHALHLHHPRRATDHRATGE